MSRETALVYGENKTVFGYLENDTFPLSDISLEPAVSGKISLELCREKTEKSVFASEVGEEKYHVTLHVGDRFACSMGKFKNEENARARYKECLEALQNGKRLSVDISIPIKILDENGDLVRECSYDDRLEDY